MPTGLLALAFMPVAACAVRLAELAGAGPVTLLNTRFFAAPLLLLLLLRPPKELTLALMMGAAWLLNLAVAERLIRREREATNQAVTPVWPSGSKRVSINITTDAALYEQSPLSDYDNCGSKRGTGRFFSCDTP